MLREKQKGIRSWIKVRKKYFRRASKLQRTIHCRKNLMKGINTGAISLGLFLNWTREDHKNLDHRTRKMMTESYRSMMVKSAGLRP